MGVCMGVNECVGVFCAPMVSGHTPHNAKTTVIICCRLNCACVSCMSVCMRMGVFACMRMGVFECMGVCMRMGECTRRTVNRYNMLSSQLRMCEYTKGKCVNLNSVAPKPIILVLHTRVRILCNNFIQTNCGCDDRKIIHKKKKTTTHPVS